jgi:hypothetical protein
MLHYQLTPRGYLEIGVLHGDSLRLARCPAFGVDPNPMPYGHFAQTTLFRQTSDDFFSRVRPEHLGVPIDFVFIDGLHLFEQALRDFRNTEHLLANSRTVVVFDDVLPRNQEEAAREQCPGDWTGDVWKVWYFLDVHRPDLTTHLVDTQPTGTMVVWDLKPGMPGSWEDPETVEHIRTWEKVPDPILNRLEAREPNEVLSQLEAWCASQ